ncbi:MAG: hypothetical protein ABI589_11580 [Burkholderiales bacterium]
MSDLALVRALHVLGVVLWIGGVAFVTLALLPGLRDLRAQSTDGMAPPSIFDALERRFAQQARWTTQLTGLTGLYMLWRLDLWARFADPAYWWMHAMVAVWALFTLMLFVIEPLVLRRRAKLPAQTDERAELRRMLLLHRVMLAVSLATVLGAVAGSHGWVF